MRRRTAITSSALVILLLLFLLGGFLYVRTTPYYSIYRLAVAVNDRDPEEALKYIDVDSVVESLVRDLSAGAGNLKEGTRKVIVAGIAMNMASVKEGVRQYIVSSIRSGEASSRAKKEGGGLGLGNFNIPQVKRNVIWDLDVETEGPTAFVRLKGKPGKAKMVRTNVGYWRFTEVIANKQGQD